MIKSWLINKRRKKILSNIRGHFLFFGHDLSHLTDEQLNERIIVAAKGFSNMVATAEQAAKGLQCGQKTHAKTTKEVMGE